MIHWIRTKISNFFSSLAQVRRNYGRGPGIFITIGSILAVALILVVILFGLSRIVSTAGSAVGSAVGNARQSVSNVKISLPFGGENADESEEDQILADTEAASDTVENTEDSGTEAESAEDTAEETAAAEAEGFIFSDSDSRYLTEEEVAALSTEELAIARNELYARRGRIFTTQKWISYFSTMSWYSGTIDANTFDEQQDTIFNDYERANRDLIIKEEKKRS